MSELWQVDWAALFVPQSSVIELILRGSIMYLFLFLMMRLQKRQPGQIGIADVLVVVLIADAAQNGLSGGYSSITEGVILVVTIALWDSALDALAYQWPRFGNWVHPPPVPLIRNGRVLWRNMRAQSVTEAELRSRLREEGLEHFSDCELCMFEGDGRISVIAKKDM